MARKTIKPLELEATVREILNEYGDKVYDVLDDSVQEVADGATEKLRAVNTFAPGGSPTGEYSSSWVNDKESSGRLASKRVVKNEEHYRLTHLLEKGHVVRNGRSRITGKSYGRAGAYPHIAPVNDWAASELPRTVERKLK